jgi:DNA-binding CsgD family transcriptional regulator/PAS domain-containing protein
MFALVLVDVSKVPDHIASAPVAMAVLDTRTGEITAANLAYAELHGRSLDAIIGLRLDEYLDGDRLAAAEAVTDAMRQGWVDALEGFVEFRRGDGCIASAYSWSVPLGPKPPHDSVLVGAAPTPGARSTGLEAYRADPSRVILGALDHDWRFSDLAVEPAALLGWPVGEENRARVQEIVHPSDAPVLLALLGRAAIGQSSTAIRVRVKGADGEWLGALITVSPLSAQASPRFGIAISLLSGEEVGIDLERAVRVEEQLWQIATEVRAGFLSAPAATMYVDLPTLTTRQNEIVRRLTQGQRVDGIARDLFVSPSTVRNHLSIVYRRLGIKSQSQLMETLRARGKTDGIGLSARLSPAGPKD